VKTSVYRATVAAAMSEDDLEEAVRDLCAVHGVVRVHHRDSRGTTAGWPDDALLGPRGAVFAELKTERGRVSRAQEAMHERMRAAGLTVVVWRPSDLLSGRIADTIRSIA
jgi:hypothetical protein